MKDVNRAKRLWLYLGISSLVIGLLALILVAVFGMKLMYIPMTVAVVFVAYGAYSAVFYFNKFVRIRLYGRIIEAACEGDAVAKQIAKKLNMKPEALSFVIKKGIKEGFIREDFIKQ